MIKTYTYVVSTGASGAGTATISNCQPPEPIHGELVEVRMGNGGTAVTSTGSTTTFTLIRKTDGGTVAKATGPAPFQHFPGHVIWTNTGGTTAYSIGGGSVVAAHTYVGGDEVNIVTASGQNNASGTIYLLVKQ